MVGLFRCFYVNSKNKGRMSFNPFPKSSEFNAEHYATLVALPAPFHKYPKPFLCLVGISRYYTIDEDAYLEFLGDNDEGMDLLAFIRTADPTKVRVAERQHAEDEPRVLESTVGRVVSLFPIAPARASNELEASVDRLFDEGASGDGQDVDVQPVAMTIDTIVEDKLREDFGVLSEVSTAGKSMAAVQSLFFGAMLEAKARGEPIPTLPFVTSSVLATSKREDRSPADSVPRPNLRTIGAPSSAPAIATVTTVTAAINTKATATRAPVAPSLFGVGSSSTVYVPRWCATNGFGLDDSRICREMLDEFPPPKFFASVCEMDHDQLFIEFNVGAARQISLNAEVRMHTEYNIKEKRKLRAVVDEQAELLKTKDGEIESLKAQLLLKEAEAAEAIRLQAKVFKFESAEQSLRGEVGFLRDQNSALEREKNELNVKVTDLSASVKVREHEVADLDAQVTAVKLQNDNLVGQVHEQETSSAGLQEKVAAYEGFVSQLEKFQDEKLEEVNEKFDKLCVDFVEMALHLEEKFYQYLLTTISGCRWLLTYGMELNVAKCLNSTEYLSTLGASISKAVEKGMQEGLSARITHGAEGRQLADVAAYNPYAEADYLSALQHLQSVNFSLITELKSNKNASVDTIINLLRLDDVFAERLGLTESHPHVDQLMVPIYHSPDQRVVGASTLNFSLEVSNYQVKKMKENITNHVSALHDVFVPLSEPLSAMALEGMEGTSGSTPNVAATLSTTFVSASTIPPISTDDYEVAHADGQSDARVDDETAADDDMNLFVSNADLNVSE
uniref:Transposase (Putative), gypsy type n=1 Tax=Tanacetum cinerariifolium TaxID=118510 RepID=A0A6L2M708_TANCI|nr:transposase (putative), gypsy type [Tanacetum cinerariifolium]